MYWLKWYHRSSLVEVNNRSLGWVIVWIIYIFNYIPQFPHYYKFKKYSLSEHYSLKEKVVDQILVLFLAPPLTSIVTLEEFVYSFLNFIKPQFLICKMGIQTILVYIYQPLAICHILCQTASMAGISCNNCIRRLLTLFHKRSKRSTVQSNIFQNTQ